MRTHHLLLALLAMPALAEEPDPRLYAPPSSDRSATAFACTVETLIAGRDCVFDGLAPAAGDPALQARDNARTAAALGERACRRASKLAAQAEPEPGVLGVCRREFEQQAAGCAADGSAPLQDAEGRFGPAARPCYSALSQVLARARTMAAATGPCCRCLAQARCAKSGEACNQQLMSGAAGPQKCMAGSCGLECRAFLPDEPPAPPPADPRLPAGDRSAPAEQGAEIRKI